MLKRKIGLKLIMDDLNLGLTTFDDRLTVQKSIYLIEELGLNLGYRFSWYLRGPYSPELTRDAFEVNEVESPVAEQAKLFKLGRHSKNVLTKFKALADDLRPRDDMRGRQVDRAKWLEMLASVHYLARYSGVGNDFERLFNELTNRKPDLRGEREIARRAWEALKSMGVMSNG